MKSAVTLALAAVLIFTPTLAVAQTTFESAVEAEIFRLIAIERGKYNLPALGTDTLLAKAARAHSLDMAKNKYFSHTSQSGCTVSCRLAVVGYSWSWYGENIYKMSGYSYTAKEYAAKIVRGWMQSAGHKANILNKNFTEHGVGVAQVGGSIYATDDFGKPR